ncbi:quinone oxidoreductase family protein [Pseudarthrobacter albicanus]|uniref:quinone oxidoreductase family protein n=1 Tax=Pseudarthrobacter albicanus TaxID=2823873 RepID=UPI001BA7FFCE|nr:zinc-binding dehydrogenase [Pseudarthrobacter albicanus]
MTEMMTALFGGAGPDWETRQVPVPKPGPGQVLVRARAVSLNNADVQMLAAADPASGSRQEYLAGFEFAGEIAALGEGAGGVRLGERVMGTTQGAFAQYVLADHRHVIAVPAGIADEDASALPTGLLTEHGALTLGDFQPGQSVLITGATSSIGLIGIQIAKSLGAGTVIATTRTESKKDLLTDAGADCVIATASQDLTGLVLDATDGQGADLVLDHVGGQTFADCLPATRVDGRIVNIGRLDQAESTINLDALSYRHLRIAGVSFGFSRPDELGHVIAALAHQVLPAVADGRIRPVIDSVLPFGQAKEAANRMRSGRAHGKIILTVP